MDTSLPEHTWAQTIKLGFNTDIAQNIILVLQTEVFTLDNGLLVFKLWFLACVFCNDVLLQCMYVIIYFYFNHFEKSDNHKGLTNKLTYKCENKRFK